MTTQTFNEDIIKSLEKMKTRHYEGQHVPVSEYETDLVTRLQKRFVTFGQFQGVWYLKHVVKLIDECLGLHQSPTVYFLVHQELMRILWKMCDKLDDPILKQEWTTQRGVLVEEYQLVMKTPE